MVLIRVASLLFLAVAHGASSTLRGLTPMDLAEDAAPVFNYAKYGSSQINLAEETAQYSLYNELLGLGPSEDRDKINFAEEDGNYGSFEYLLSEEEQADGIDLMALGIDLAEEVTPVFNYAKYGRSQVDLAEEAARDSLYNELLGLGSSEDGDEINFAEEDGNYGSFDYLLSEEEQANGIDLDQDSFYEELFGSDYDNFDKIDLVEDVEEEEVPLFNYAKYAN